MSQAQLIPHLFRNESRKITSVLCKCFGIEFLQVAEDITHDTFLKALETWTYKGVPPDPVAWLYVVAKNQARNYLKRNTLFLEKISPALQYLNSERQDMDIDTSDQHIRDSELQMLFAICHPSISSESQVGLALKILCGFGIDEIATAFLTSREVINKRLFRAKDTLRRIKADIEMPPDSEIEKRLDAVLTTIYLLFSEGYYSECQDSVLREDFCMEAIRLTALLLENKQTHQPRVDALMALMYFQASRFPARRAGNREIVLYDDQDESLWDQVLIARGAFHLRAASTGSSLSTYHLEAAIAYWHTIKEDTPQKWENILSLFDQLLQIQYSPVAALNRTFALFKVKGPGEAIAVAEKLELTDNHYYFTLLGTLYLKVDQEKARAYLQKAYLLARTSPDKHTILKKMATCNKS